MGKYMLKIIEPMKYFIVTHTIRDGEYEYMSQTPVMANNEKQAVKIVSKEDQEWIERSDRIAEINNVKEITHEEYEVIKKYIY